MSSIDFENKILIPSFSGVIQSNIAFAIHKAFEDKLVLASDKFLKLFNLPNFNQLTINDTNQFLIKHFSKETIKLVRCLEHKIKVLIESKQNSDFLLVCNYPNGEQKLLHAIPVCYPDGRFYGVKYNVIDNIIDNIPESINLNFIVNQMKTQDCEWLILDNINKNLTNNSIANKYKFNNKEKKILSMLISGYTQKEIAYEFSCSQPYVAKIITNIATKLGLQIHSVKLVINAAISMGGIEFIERQ